MVDLFLAHATKQLPVKLNPDEVMQVEWVGLDDLAAEVAAMDTRTDGYDQISVANGYLKYVQHRKEALIRQIGVLNEQAETVQNQLRKSIHSQSMLQNPP